jgi:hypothetical protein
VFDRLGKLTPENHVEDYLKRGFPEEARKVIEGYV